MALRKLMELGNLQDKTTHAVTPSKEGVGGFGPGDQGASFSGDLSSKRPKSRPLGPSDQGAS